MIGIFIDGLSEWPFRPLPICRSIRLFIEGSCPAIQGEGGAKGEAFCLAPCPSMSLCRCMRELS